MKNHGAKRARRRKNEGNFPFSGEIFGENKKKDIEGTSSRQELLMLKNLTIKHHKEKSTPENFPFSYVF